jgi:hypothetical protein
LYAVVGLSLLPIEIIEYSTTPYVSMPTPGLKLLVDLPVKGDIIRDMAFHRVSWLHTACAASAARYQRFRNAIVVNGARAAGHICFGAAAAVAVVTESLTAVHITTEQCV